MHIPYVTYCVSHTCWSSNMVQTEMWTVRWSPWAFVEECMVLISVCPILRFGPSSQPQLYLCLVQISNCWHANVLPVYTRTVKKHAVSPVPRKKIFTFFVSHFVFCFLVLTFLSPGFLVFGLTMSVYSVLLFPAFALPVLDPRKECNKY